MECINRCRKFLRFATTSTRGDWAMPAMLLAASVAIALPVASSAAAEGLNPPPPAYTTCKSTGGGTICRATLTTSYAFPGEFTCTEGFDIDEEGTTERQVIYIYDRDGNLAKRVTRVTSLAGTFSNSDTGQSVEESGHFTITHDYLTPGDLSTDQTTFDGLFAKVVLPGNGIVLQDAGTIVFAPDGSVPREAGFHQFQNSDLAELCDALA
jgi:hypothetical protein